MMKVLFYGYGNPGRRDDGLGIAFIERLEEYVREQNIPNIDFDTNYQLNIEDAETISHYDRVIFCDATTEPVDDLCITRVTPSEARIEFTMHAVSPAFVLALCQSIYRKSPDTWLLHLKGYDWSFREGMTSNAEKNLRKAIDLFLPYLHQLTKATPLFLASAGCTH